MKNIFPLFQSHLDLAHLYWSKLIEPGDTVIDATCGNGNDTLKLCQFALSKNKGKVYAFDIQQDAIESSKLLLSAQLPEDRKHRVEFHLRSHATFPDSLQENSVKLIVYNLGYLPGGDKTVTTHLSTTLQSLEQAIRLIQPFGAVSITCYPGHPEGAREQEALLSFASELSPREWSCCHHVWVNRKLAPSFLLIQKFSCQTPPPCGSIATDDSPH